MLESANFCVCGIASQEQIKALLDTCEATRSGLSTQWLGSDKSGSDKLGRDNLDGGKSGGGKSGGGKSGGGKSGGGKSGGGKAGVWEPKCYIVLHPTAESYLREVGEGQMTAGSSLIEFAGNRLVTRRVDLRADHPEGYLGALAHELTHVVIAERFIERQIPRWADEGMAVLADTPIQAGSASRRSRARRDPIARPFAWSN